MIKTGLLSQLPHCHANGLMGSAAFRMLSWCCHKESVRILTAQGWCSHDSCGFYIVTTVSHPDVRVA